MAIPQDYTLDIRLQGAAPERVTIEDKIAVGSAPNAEISIDGLELDPVHCIFRVQNEVLTVLNMGKRTDTLLDKNPLECGRMYILDKGDKINIGKLEIIIRKAAGGERGSSTPDTDQTDPSINLDEMQEFKPESTEEAQVEDENIEMEEHDVEEVAEEGEKKKGFGKVLGGLFGKKRK